MMYGFLVAVQFLLVSAASVNGLTEGEPRLGSIARIKEPSKDRNVLEMFDPLSPPGQCNRYCVMRDSDGNWGSVRYVNLFWSANGINITDDQGADYADLIARSVDSIGQDRVDGVFRDCQIRLELNCAGAGDYVNYAITNKDREDSSVPIVKLDQASQEKSRRILCDPGNLDSAPVTVNVRGNVTSVSVRIPVGSGDKPSRGLGLECFERRNGGDEPEKRLLKIQARSSLGGDEVASENKTEGTAETLANLKLGEESARYGNEEVTERRRALIELNRNSNLLAEPGTVHRVIFDVANGCVLPVRYAFRARSSTFRIYNIQPQYAWIYPGQLSHVAVDVVVPVNTGPDATNTVTLGVAGTEIKDKTALLYVQSSVSRITDDTKPTIEYSFNNNCAGRTDKERCSKSRWSADITAQDYGSGLKRVTGSPNEVYPQTEFLSGTREPVKFYYTATCCDPSVTITAVDLLNNIYIRTIDVTVWDNFSEAEIAAITLGALLILLLLVLLVLIIVYCVGRKRSHDLPYTHRYGSRPPPERTSF